MKALKHALETDAVYLGKGIVKADAFINHQLLPDLTAGMGATFKARFKAAGIEGVTRIVTAEVSGIAPALATAMAMDVPMVFARKKKPAFMTGGLYSARAQSRTKSEAVTLYLSERFLGPADRVIIVDDFLATASTLNALVDIVRVSGAVLAGIGCVVEKVFEGGRDALSHLDIPVISLARVDLTDGEDAFIVL